MCKYGCLEVESPICQSFKSHDTKHRSMGVATAIRPGVRGWRICTSRSLGRAQQATFLVTLAEVVFIWGAFIPSPWLQGVKSEPKRHQKEPDALDFG